MMGHPKPATPWIALAAVVLAGCAGNRYCLEPQAYQSAETYPPIAASGELSVPESPSALRIPPPPAKAVPFGFEDKTGEVVCLDQPPMLNVKFVDSEPTAETGAEKGEAEKGK